MRRLVWLSAAAVMFPVMAMAANPVSATLAQPVSSASEIIAGNTVWDCSGTTCTTVSDPRGAASLSACYELVRKVGTVTALGNADRSLDAATLATCNAQ